VRLEVFEDIPEDPQLRSAWNGLALQMERPEVFYTYEWALAVFRAYHDSRKPLLLLAYEGESLMGAVAFARENGKDELTFLTANTADYCDFISTPDRRREFVESVLEELQSRKIGKLALTNLPADSFSVPSISQAASRGKYYLHSRSAYFCARVVLGSPEQRLILKQTTVGKKRLRRNLREFEKLGALSVQHDTQWRQIEPLLQAFNHAHIARFLATGRASSLLQPERRKFLHELARELSSSCWITLSRLLVDDVPIAWNYGFTFPGSWFWYQPTVENDARYREFSPGYCLLAKIIETASDQPDVNVVDLGLGAEDYKDRFATSARETVYIALNQSFASHARAVTRHHAATLAKSAPALEKGIRGALSTGRHLRMPLQDMGLRAFVKTAAQRLGNRLFGSDEVLFFEWDASNSNRKPTTTLVPLTSDLLGAAAIRYADEHATIAYLMRSAGRFCSVQDQGFALLAADGTPVHFCWVGGFEGFKVQELDRTLHAPSADAVLIFDCFTPRAFRQRGFFLEAISALACRLLAQKKGPWICGAATDPGSLCGIRKSGFAYRFSLGRKRMFFFTRRGDSFQFVSTEGQTSSAPAA
jgi:CelD/BcsL family acetyltransferase involved in cellulose biosynthesis